MLAIFVVSKVALGQVFLGVLWSASVSIIPPILHTQLHLTTPLICKAAGRNFENLQTKQRSIGYGEAPDNKYFFLMNIRIQIDKVGHTLAQTMDCYNEKNEGTTEIPRVLWKTKIHCRYLYYPYRAFSYIQYTKQPIHSTKYIKIQNMKCNSWYVWTPICSGIGVLSSGKHKEHKSNTLIQALIALTYWLTYLLLTYSMKQSPSWEANRFAASQEIPRILWNPKVHYRIHTCPPPVPNLSSVWTFRNKIRFYGEELLAPHPTSKLEGHPLSAVRDCFINIFAATLHIGGRSSIRNLRTRHAVVTGTHFSRDRPKYRKILKY